MGTGTRDSRMEPLVTAAEIREMDRQTIEDLGLPGVVLMENAGRATAEVVLREHAAGASGQRTRRPVAILCGAGNNGGDGFVVARHLHQAGVRCAVYLTKDPADLKGDAATNLAVLQRLPVPIVPVRDEAAVRDRAHDLRTAPVIVDALLGTGLSSEVRGVPRALIETANAGLGRRVAVDVPSGVRADDGAVLGVAFRADVTVTFAAAKLGLWLHPGAEYAGAVVVADIGIPPQVVAAVAPQADRILWEEAAAALAPRPRTGHKGTFGHCLVIAGAPGKGGAALLAGRGALVAGAGPVTVAT
ncbi:MAG: NAD(P)H-hydrate epimerase [Gammaproteobacteria bacterium]|nr:NAD(P)H-hydrate epimerase [Gammaproteobacteria bacterium]